MWEPVRHLIASENKNYDSKFRVKGVVVERQRRAFSRDHRCDGDGLVDSVRRISQYSKAFLGFVDIIFHHVL